MNPAPRTNLTAFCRLIITLLAPVFCPDLGQANSEISFEWVTIGNPGNPNDPLTGAPTNYGPLPVRGAVPYVYSISKYETTIGQYAAFANAVGPANLYNILSLSHRDAVRGLTLVGTPGNYSYHVRNGISGLSSANLPITYIDYLTAVRFVNWLHNGQGHGSTETGAYDISQGQITRLSRAGGVATFTTSEPHSLQVGDWVSVVASGYSAVGYLASFIVTARTDTTFSYSSGQSDLPEQEAPGSMTGVSARKPGARYWIPSENEWYKAAYYDPGSTGPEDDYWRFPWGGDEAAPGFGNYYVVRYIATSQIDFQMVDATYITDVRGGSLSPSGTRNQAGNVEEWTEGDNFSGGPHTRGGWWDKSYAQSRPQTHAYHRMASYLIENTAPLPNADGIGFRVATTANPPDGGLRNGDSIRFHPRMGHGARMVGGVFEGSDYGSSYTVLHTISQVPPNGWTEVSVNFDQFRYFRYRGPENSFGNVAEIEFYRSGAKVAAAASGTPGSWNNQGSTFDKAFDGNMDTFVDAPEPNGTYVELDTGKGTPTGTAPGCDHLTVTSGVSGDYLPDQRVPVTAPLAPDGLQFAGWAGFMGILDDPKSPNTIATIPGWGIDLWLTATYKPLAPGMFTLQVTGGSGGGTYPTGSIVTVTADPAPAGQRFSWWTGDNVILSNPSLATTTALIPAMNVAIAATYNPVVGPLLRLEVSGGSGGGSYPEGVLVPVSANPPPAGLKFTGWAGDADILVNAWTPTTTAQIPSRNVRIVSIYSAIDASDKIRFYPRQYHTARMVGGIFEGTNGDPTHGPYEPIYLVSTEPPLAWTEVNVDLKNYEYVRYRGPDNSHANVAEIEFYHAGQKLTGAAFGSFGSWNDLGNTVGKALDGNVDTFFDAPNGNGSYVGIRTREIASNPPDQIRFYPRLHQTARMVGGIFEGTNGDPVNGPYTFVARIWTEPSPGWNELKGEGMFQDFRYLRYRGPENSWGNVAEIEFYRRGVKLSGVPFGTPGSWYDSGNTLDKALDGNIDTFFDAPIASGAYVGIDAGVPDTIRFYPRLYHAARMVGGVFEGTNGNPVNGPYQTIYTVQSNPSPAWNEVVVDLKDYRYLRYRGPENSWGNVAEIEFYRNGAKVSGGAFGTPAPGTIWGTPSTRPSTETSRPSSTLP